MHRRRVVEILYQACSAYVAANAAGVSTRQLHGYCPKPNGPYTAEDTATVALCCYPPVVSSAARRQAAPAPTERPSAEPHAILSTGPGMDASCSILSRLGLQAPSRRCVSWQRSRWLLRQSAGPSWLESMMLPSDAIGRLDGVRRPAAAAVGQCAAAAAGVSQGSGRVGGLPLATGGGGRGLGTGQRRQRTGSASQSVPGSGMPQAVGASEAKLNDCA